MLWVVDDVLKEEITQALDRVNQHFDNNIVMDDLVDCALNLDNRGMWKFSVHVANNLGPGARLERPRTEFYIPRATWSICWDVRFLLFYELPDCALIQVGNHWIRRTDNDYPVQYFRKPGGTYSILDCCECEGKQRHISAARSRKWSSPVRFHL